ncbi:diguanylate cyclase (GGDEF)-like protein [Sporomusaceae bacterium BoRhaA]|uniref:GGDEF domain-containing protein n=1 Tax=Pelorhabdus rhamnosifermentans TaxID=2772457 RepID=UPI001C0622FD|nr:GGDEF domain-containing protein [Pelorhabdus rhamnosifermentans]MBU2700683.1 diguanylate cyclase (GGDEF)-like protein [Pelorhabdus rhamnosifermentans]
MLSYERQDTSCYTEMTNSEMSLTDQIGLGELKNVILARKIRTVFQPIVSLVDGQVLGYEALSRGPNGSELEMPTTLFYLARKFDLLWELELLCLSQALLQGKKIPHKGLLFLNIDPQIIRDPRFESELLSKWNWKLTSSSVNYIILEITEGAAIEDVVGFTKTLASLVNKGCKIAMDDTGTGYSSLSRLVKIHPHFIKIDMDLVRDIDKDRMKQALMKALYKFSTLTNIKIIAEGIETAAELNELIRIGIPYGQGFYLQQPSSQLTEISEPIRQQILYQVHSKEQENYYTPITMPIGAVARMDRGLPATTLGYQIIDYFNKNSRAMGVCIVEDGKPVGLLMKDKFLGNLATQYGIALYMHRPIDLVMDKNPIVVDYHLSLEQVSKLAVSRSEERLYDYIIVTKNEKYYGVITIRRLLEKTTQVELNRAKHSNPLTGLPGNVLIEHEINCVLLKNRPYAVIYFDLDNFKPYNDVYGFESGDRVLYLTAKIIQQEMEHEANLPSFIGHIGGDDFIAVVHDWNVQGLCQNIIASFDRQIHAYYGEKDIRQGYILAKNRHGKEERFPIISLSIAVVTNRNSRYFTAHELAESATLLKKKCKLSWQSCYCIDGI